MNIQEIRNLDDGSVIPPFTTRVKFVNDRTGKVQCLKIEDDAGEVIKLVLINRPDIPMEYKGKQVRIEKAIAGDNTFNGKTTREVKLLTRGTIELNGSVSHTTESIDSDVGTGRVPTNKEFKEHVKEIVNGNGNKAIFGAMAGCAFNQAVRVLLESCEGEGIAYYKSRQYSLDLYQIASDHIRVLQTLESGQLAPSAKDREALVAAPADNVIEVARELFQAEEEVEE